MAEVTMPKMSDTMEEGTVVRWLKHEGDPVNEGETIAEIETDKANVEMEAFEPGILSKILVNEGETVPVGQPIAMISAPETAAAPQAPPEKTPEPSHPEIPGTAAPQARATDQVPSVTTPTPPETPPEVPKEKPVEEEAAPEEERVKASPLARRMAEEEGIDLSQIHGTGPNGRIVETDVENFLKAGKKEAAPPPQPKPVQEAPPPPTPAPSAPGAATEERELSRMRKTIAERMTKSKQTIPHFYVTADVAMDRAAQVREELNAHEDQTKVSFTDMIIKATALALKAFTQVNASFDEDKLLIHKNINVGLAVALPDGLIAPVVHDADKKPLRQIAAETKDLARRAKENTLTVTEYTGGTFTISNLGMFDVEEFAAIINPPESASIAVGTIREAPVVEDGAIAISRRMKMTISADHRVLDGAVAAQFLNEVRHYLESPTDLL